MARRRQGGGADQRDADPSVTLTRKPDTATRMLADVVHRLRSDGAGPLTPAGCK